MYIGTTLCLFLNYIVSLKIFLLILNMKKFNNLIFSYVN